MRFASHLYSPPLLEFLRKLGPNGAYPPHQSYSTQIWLLHTAVHATSSAPRLNRVQMHLPQRQRQLQPVKIKLPLLLNIVASLLAFLQCCSANAGTALDRPVSLDSAAVLSVSTDPAVLATLPLLDELNTLSTPLKAIKPSSASQQTTKQPRGDAATSTEAGVHSATAVARSEAPPPGVRAAGVVVRTASTAQADRLYDGECIVSTKTATSCLKVSGTAPYANATLCLLSSKWCWMKLSSCGTWSWSPHVFEKQEKWCWFLAVSRYMQAACPQQGLKFMPLSGSIVQLTASFVHSKDASMRFAWAVLKDEKQLHTWVVV